MSPEEIKAAKVKLAKSSRDLYADTLMMGGLEMHDDHLKARNVRALISAGLVELGPKRGPGGKWQRMWAIEDKERV